MMVTINAGSTYTADVIPDVGKVTSITPIGIDDWTSDYAMSGATLTPLLNNNPQQVIIATDSGSANGTYTLPVSVVVAHNGKNYTLEENIRIRITGGM